MYDEDGNLYDQRNYWVNSEDFPTPEPSPKFHESPVLSGDIKWIQWFGATETAFIDGVNWNYDGYCQGYHCAIDYGSYWGAPVYAGIFGTVLAQGKGNGGYFVIIGAGDYQIIYQALDGNFTQNIGDSVNPNTQIAGVGNHTADSNKGNTHLHMEVRYSSSGDSEWKDRIANPILFMSMTDYYQLRMNRQNSPKNNIEFHGAEQDPRKQRSPIIRGGPVLW